VHPKSAHGVLIELVEEARPDTEHGDPQAGAPSLQREPMRGPRPTEEV
jgi:hypothetical protein